MIPKELAEIKERCKVASQCKDPMSAWNHHADLMLNDLEKILNYCQGLRADLDQLYEGVKWLREERTKLLIDLEELKSRTP